MTRYQKILAGAAAVVLFGALAGLGYVFTYAFWTAYVLADATGKTYIREACIGAVAVVTAISLLRKGHEL